MSMRTNGSDYAFLVHNQLAFLAACGTVPIEHGGMRAIRNL